MLLSPWHLLPVTSRRKILADLAAADVEGCCYGENRKGEQRVSGVMAHVKQRSILDDAPYRPFPKNAEDVAQTAINVPGYIKHSDYELLKNIQSNGDKTGGHFVFENARTVVGYGSDGAVVDQNGFAITELCQFADFLKKDSKLHIEDMDFHEREIPEAAVLFDAAWTNYYHFILLGMGRFLNYMGELKSTIPVILPDYESAFSEGRVRFSQANFQTIMNATLRKGLVKELSRGVYTVKKLHVFWGHHSQATSIVEIPSFLDAFAALDDLLLASFNKPRSKRRILISRRLGPDPRITSEEEMRADGIAESLGFERLFLEKMTVEDQISAFAHAEVVLGAHGAGLTNIVFSPPHCLVIELNKRLCDETELRPWFYQICSRKGMNYIGIDLDKGLGALEGLKSDILLFGGTDGPSRRDSAKTESVGMIQNFDHLSNSAQETFSQLGEDLLILHFLNHQKHGIYVDVGCHHPFRFSNTALLHSRYGWSGVNIDADARAIAAFQQHRPNDINLLFAIGPVEGSVDFAVFEEGAVNSAVPEVVMANRAHWGEPAIRTVPMMPLTTILESHLSADRNIDYLNVDVEGLDLEVLQSLDWKKYRPKVVSVEIHGLDLNNIRSSHTVVYMDEVGYGLMSYSVVTAIFTRRPDLPAGT